jgi:hypothetical protein
MFLPIIPSSIFFLPLVYATLFPGPFIGNEHLERLGCIRQRQKQKKKQRKASPSGATTLPLEELRDTYRQTHTDPNHSFLFVYEVASYNESKEAPETVGARGIVLRGRRKKERHITSYHSASHRSASHRSASHHLLPLTYSKVPTCSILTYRLYVRYLPWCVHQAHVPWAALAAYRRTALSPVLAHGRI